MKTCVARLSLTLLLLALGSCSKSEESKGGATKAPEPGAPAEGKAPAPAEGKAPAPAGGVEIVIACGAVGQDSQRCQEAADVWAQKTGNKVKLVATPTSASEALALFQQLLSSSSSDIDVIRTDVIWPGILGGFLIDLKQYSKGAEKEHFQSIVENNTVDGKLVSMPWFLDAGLLYYRKDLLEKYKEKPPTTWEELTATAKKIQEGERKAGNKDIWGFVFQGKAYEGLTCNALEWVSSYGGGTIVDASGKVTIDNPDAAAAIDLAASWIGTISPQGVLAYEEEESRGIFQSGKAVFMRNWPYAWKLSQGDDSPIKGKVGISALPKGTNGKSAATLGGWNISVSKFSKHPAEAADLALYLTGPEEEKRGAIKYAQHPTILSIYQDKEVLEANPHFAELVDVFKNTVPRPSTPTGEKYNQVSSEFWNAVHTVLSKQKSAKDSLAALKTRLERMQRGGKWK